MEQSEEITLAKQLFNQCWDLIEKADRSAEEDLAMLHLAQTSRWHWGNVGTAKEWAIGEWQCARVYSILGQGDAALRHASMCMELTSNLPTPHFMHASAAEGLALAHYVAGNLAEANRYKSQAIAALEGVGEEDAKHIRDQINELPF
jgi:hypothetical protein